MLILIRHAEAEGAKGRAIGQTDLPLSPKGEEEAHALGRGLQHLRGATLVASPLKRTWQTAAQITKWTGIAATKIDALKEIHLGDWDGQPFQDIKRNFPTEYEARGKDIEKFRPPHGESFHDLAGRALPLVRNYAAQDNLTVAVTHAGIIRLALCESMNVPYCNMFSMKPAHCHLTMLSAHKSKLIVTAFNIPPCEGLADIIDSITKIS